jgi:hypothetical protein
MGNLGDGLRAMRQLALQQHICLQENTALRHKLFDELLFEAQKFLVYRMAKMRGREYNSLHRIRGLRAMLKNERETQLSSDLMTSSMDVSSSLF